LSNRIFDDCIISDGDNMKIDLNLMSTFAAVYRERSVGRAAEVLNLSQPAVSGSLARLRHLVGDPLFTRTHAGMIPTVRADELYDPVQRALEANRRFDPSASTRIFRMALSEIGQILFLPALSERLRQIDSGIRLIVAPTPENVRTESFDRGELELALGVWPRLRRDIVSRKLFRDRWLCIARPGSPATRQELTLPAWLELEHVVISSFSGGDGVISRTLNRDGRARRVALEVTNFLAALLIVSRTDMVATVPAELAELYATSTPLVLMPPPIEIPEIDLRLYWHRRCQDDAGLQWLIGTVCELFQSMDCAD
jgi:DNA-binding transcriptional LysR family regulator